MSILIPVVKAELTFSEGPVYQPQIFKGDEAFWELSLVISRIPGPSPPTGCYHKTDFKLTFEDEKTYEGRIDVVGWGNKGHESLSHHIIDHCLFYAGLKCPSHMTMEDYQRFVLGVVLGAGHMEKYQEFLATYNVGQLDETTLAAFRGEAIWHTQPTSPMVVTATDPSKT